MKTILILVLSVFCNIVFGQLTFTHTSDTIVYPPDSETSRYCTIEIGNPTQSTIQLSVIRLENDVAPYWLSAICTSVDCYFTTIDSASVDILPGTVEEVKLYFKYWVNTTDTARALFLFRNEDNPSNQYEHNFYGIDSSEVLSVNPVIFEQSDVLVFPNPFSKSTTIQFPEKLVNENVQVSNINGQIVQSMLVNGNTITLEKGNLPEGIYFMRLASRKFPVQKLVIY